MSPRKRSAGRPRTTRSPLLTVSIDLTMKQVDRVGRLAGIAAKETGRKVSRSKIVRELLELGLDEAERIRHANGTLVRRG